MFRQEALDHITASDRLDEPARLVSPANWVALATLACLAAAAVIWSLFGTLSATVAAPGIVTVDAGRISAEVSPREGVLLALFAAPGDRIAAGDPIARIDTAALDRAIAEVERAIAGEEGAAPRPDAAPPLQRSTTGDAARRTAEDDAGLRATLARLRARRAAGSTVTALGPGTVVRTLARPGTVVAAGDPLVATASPDAALVVDGLVRLRDAEGLAEGQAVTILPPRGGERTPLATGTVRSVGAVAGPSTLFAADNAAETVMPGGSQARVRVRIALDDTDLPAATLRLGQPVTVEILTDRRAPVSLVLPGLEGGTAR
jgi:multidrug resistance efflux pump